MLICMLAAHKFWAKVINIELSTSVEIAPAFYAITYATNIGRQTTRSLLPKGRKWLSHGVVCFKWFINSVNVREFKLLGAVPILSATRLQ